MEVKLPRLISFVASQPWAILESYVPVMARVLAQRAAGHYRTPEEIAAAIAAAEHPRPISPPPALLGQEVILATADGRAVASQGEGIAVINIMGILAQHAQEVENVSGPGGTSTEMVSAALKQVRSNPAIRGVVLNIDSPGGGVFGLEELWQDIYSMRGEKKVVALANSMAASAAYYVASAAEELAVAPGGQVGSIGTFIIHEDLSKALEAEGINVSLIKAGKFKAEAMPFLPLSDDAREAMQARVNDAYGAFVKAVGRGRGVTNSEVRDGFGQGRLVSARDAVDQGMADRVATLDETIARMLGRGGSTTKAPLPPGRAQAADEDAPEPEAPPADAPAELPAPPTPEAPADEAPAIERALAERALRYRDSDLRFR